MTQNEQTKAVIAITTMHNALSPLERSFLEHYRSRKALGSVPTMNWDGTWFNAREPEALFQLYLRLPARVQKVVEKPQGLDTYIKNINETYKGEL